MTDVLLFHHAQGLTPGIREFADRLRAAGHEVTTADLFEGRTFDSIEEGVAHARETGFDTLLERARTAAASVPEQVVYAGISLGVMPAELLAQTRPHARGALLFESCVPPSEFGGSWPADVPVQVHGMDADPYFAGEGDIDAARELVRTVERAELFTYPGDRHLFFDSSLPSYDAEAAALLRQRVLTFLAEVG